MKAKQFGKDQETSCIAQGPDDQCPEWTIATSRDWFHLSEAKRLLANLQKAIAYVEAEKAKGGRG